MNDADEIVARLGLKSHPEGGHYAETYRAPAPPGERGACTVIHFLLKEGERSHWHRVDAEEIWAWHAGAPLILKIGQHQVTLGPDVAAGQAPHAVVPAHEWQAAQPLGGWCLVSCVVAPAFQFAGFEMAPPGWEPCTISR
jgi:predicted cupin superfamily sugar epimerase